MARSLSEFRLARALEKHVEDPHNAENAREFDRAYALLTPEERRAFEGRALPTAEELVTALGLTYRAGTYILTLWRKFKGI